MYLYDAIKNYQVEDIYPFHMPGHKRNKDFINESLLDFDLTEIEGLDNLHNAQGIIKNSQMRAAEVFGADESFFLVNGSTSGIIASVLATVKEDEGILIARNSHRSVYSGIIFSGAVPYYVYPQMTVHGFAGGVIAQDIEDVLLRHNDIKAVFITSPTYEGIVSNIKLISQVCKKHNKILIVDEAHGSHFVFGSSFPEPAIKNGADIVIQSLHKTLPTLSQSSLLHIKGERVNIDLIKQALALIQTSSPSYIFMALMDKCIGFFSQNKNYIDKYANDLLILRMQLLNCKNILLLDPKNTVNCGAEDIDISKLVLIIKKDFSGSQLNKILLNEYKIQVEMVSLNYVLAMTSPADTVGGFDKLKRAVFEIDKTMESYSLCNKKQIIINKAVTRYKPRELFHMKTKKIPINDSKGKTSADFIIMYPPGIPILVPGEIISGNIINTVMEHRYDQSYIIGVDIHNNIKIAEE